MYDKLSHYYHRGRHQVAASPSLTWRVHCTDDNLIHSRQLAVKQLTYTTYKEEDTEMLSANAETWSTIYHFLFQF